MFKILDGRTEFYQWDLERKLVVADSTIKQVHFCNRFGNCSLIRATYEVNGVTLVDVPNIILQDSFNLHAYGYDVNYTKFESVFNIVPRTKPENYINTEEELKVWDELEQKVIDLENKVDGEGIQAAVKQYLLDNPPQAGATTEEAAQIAQNKEDIAQLRQEFDNFEIPEVDLEGYATEKYVDDAVGAIDIPDVSGYVNQSYVDGKCMVLQQMIPSVEGLATEEYVDEAIASIDIPEGGGGTVDLTGYATEEYVDNAIEAIDIPVVEVDKAYVTEQMNVVYQDITKRYYVNADYVTEKLEGYATEEYVDEAVANAGGGGGGSAVAVDNATIIQNADGTISTAIGGSRVETTPATEVQHFTSDTGVTCKADNWPVVEFTTTKSIPTNSRYTLKFKLDGEWYETEIYRDGTTQNFLFADKLTSYGFFELDYNSTTKYWLLFESNYAEFYNNHFITEVVVTKPAIYDYEPLNPNYLPYNPEHFSIGDVSGLLETPTGGYVRANNESIYFQGEGNRVFDLKNNTQRFIGLGRNDYQQSAMYDGTVIGQRNILNTSGGGIMVVGSDNQLAIGNSNAMVGWYNEAKTSSYNAVYNNLIGYKNILKGYTSTLYPTNTTLIGTENWVNKLNSKNSVLVGYKNSLRTSSTPTGATGNGFTSFFFGEGLSNVNGDDKTQGAYVIDCAVGKYNAQPGLEDVPFVVGMGTTDNASDRKNALSVSSTGQLNVNGTVNTQGADYAEYFEWVDGNPEAEDRIGYAVTLEGKKIRIANANDDVIGFISGTAATVGEDAPWHWSKRYMRDEFGRVLFEDKEIEHEYVERDEEGNETIKTYTRVHKVEVQNPEWNPEQEYIPRKFRAEWDTVGLLGKLFVRDDGSCEVGGYAVVTDGGIVTAASGKTNMRVLERTSENIVRVLFK